MGFTTIKAYHFARICLELFPSILHKSKFGDVKFRPNKWRTSWAPGKCFIIRAPTLSNGVFCNRFFSTAFFWGSTYMCVVTIEQSLYHSWKLFSLTCLKFGILLWPPADHPNGFWNWHSPRRSCSFLEDVCKLQAATRWAQPRNLKLRNLFGITWHLLCGKRQSFCSQKIRSCVQGQNPRLPSGSRWRRMRWP